jgi:hypothetical protein
VTPTLSSAVKVVIGTDNELDVAGMLNTLTVGGTVSGRMMVVEAPRLAETCPHPSLAQAYRVFDPDVAKV